MWRTILLSVWGLRFPNPVKVGCSQFVTPFSLTLTITLYLRLSLIAHVGEKHVFFLLWKNVD